MPHPLKTLIFLTLTALLLPISAHARLGDTERELVARFGQPVSRSKELIMAQGKTIELGPKLMFRQGDWYIYCDLIDDRCARISYSKSGAWTDNQILTVLTANAQGAKWTEVSNPNLRNLVRDWKREDGATAHWQAAMSISLSTPAYDRAKRVAEAKAKAAASEIPHL
jgi:hypothetical protein